MMSAEPNWYDDPEEADVQRWWDGRQWTPERRPKLPAGSPHLWPGIPHGQHPLMPQRRKLSARAVAALAFVAVGIMVVGLAYAVRASVASNMEAVAMKWDGDYWGQLLQQEPLPEECRAVHAYKAAIFRPNASPGDAPTDPYGHGARVSRSVSVEHVYVDPNFDGGLVVYTDHSDFAIKGKTVTWVEVLVVKEDGQWKVCGYQLDSTEGELMKGHTAALGWNFGGRPTDLWGR